MIHVVPLRRLISAAEGLRKWDVIGSEHLGATLTLAGLIRSLSSGYSVLVRFYNDYLFSFFRSICYFSDVIRYQTSLDELEKFGRVSRERF